MIDNNSKTEAIDKFINELKEERNKKSSSSESMQELYIQVLNKLGNLLFSIERVENNDEYQSDAYYEDILLDIKDVEDLEKEHQSEWSKALKKAVETYLNTALINIDNTNQQQKDFSFNRAINVLTFCKNKNIFKEKYYEKIDQ